MDAQRIFELFDTVQAQMVKNILAQVRSGRLDEAQKLDYQAQGIEAMRANLHDACVKKGLL